MFSVDGMTWDIPCGIERVSEIKPSEISGLMLDRTWFNDVLGTYLRYEVTLAASLYQTGKYAVIYEKLTEPVDGHSFVLPYNEDTVTVTGRVERIADVYVRLPGNRNYWKGTKFTVIANHPTKEITLEQMLVRGRAPVPEVTDMVVGNAFTFSESGWEETPDGERMYF